jgi:hypothetical protein
MFDMYGGKCPPSKAKIPVEFVKNSYLVPPAQIRTGAH